MHGQKEKNTKTNEEMKSTYANTKKAKY